jgi:N-methylhydantoinase A
MHYVGQTHSVAVTLPFEAEAASEAAIRSAFESAYTAAFSRLLPGIPVRLATLRVVAVGRRPQIDLAALAPAPGGTLAAARTGARRAWFGGAWHEAAVYDRLALPVGARIDGPAILEQADATIVIDPGLAATVDRFGNLVMRRA